MIKGNHISCSRRRFTIGLPGAPLMNIPLIEIPKCGNSIRRRADIIIFDSASVPTDKSARPPHTNGIGRDDIAVTCRVAADMGIRRPPVM